MIVRIFKVLNKYPLSIIILTIICYLSFFNTQSTDFVKIKNLDKIVHFAMYGGFCSVLWFEYFLTHDRIRITKIIWWTIVAPVFFGAAIEVMQECLTSARGGDFFDFLFNSLGVLFAALFSFILTMPIMKKYGLWNRRGRGKWN